MASCNSWQYLVTILAKIFPRSWQDLAKILLRYPWRVDPGERRYQLIKIVYLPSLSILIGVSIEWNIGRRKSTFVVSQFWAGFRFFPKNLKSIWFCRLSRTEWYIFCSRNILNKMIVAFFHRTISHLSTCKSTKFYLSSLIFWKWLIVLKSRDMHGFTRFVGVDWA